MHALCRLGHQPPVELDDATPTVLLAWATEAWQRTAIPRMLTVADAATDRSTAALPIDTADDAAAT